MKIFSKPHGYQFTKLGHALELHKLGGVYIQRLWVYRLPLALAWWARGSTAVKRSLFNSGVGRNIWLSIQIFDLNRFDPAPGSGFRDRGWKFSWKQFTLPRSARLKMPVVLLQRVQCVSTTGKTNPCTRSNKQKNISNFLMHRIRQISGRTPVGPGTRPISGVHRCRSYCPPVKFQNFKISITFWNPTSQKGAFCQIVKKVPNFTL